MDAVTFVPGGKRPRHVLQDERLMRDYLSRHLSRADNTFDLFPDNLVSRIAPNPILHRHQARNNPDPRYKSKIRIRNRKEIGMGSRSYTNERGPLSTAEKIALRQRRIQFANATRMPEHGEDRPRQASQAPPSRDIGYGSQRYIFDGNNPESMVEGFYESMGPNFHLNPITMQQYQQEVQQNEGMQYGDAIQYVTDDFDDQHGVRVYASTPNRAWHRGAVLRNPATATSVDQAVRDQIKRPRVYEDSDFQYLEDRDFFE